MIWFKREEVCKGDWAQGWGQGFGKCMPLGEGWALGWGVLMKGSPRTRTQDFFSHGDKHLFFSWALLLNT